MQKHQKYNNKSTNNNQRQTSGVEHTESIKRLSVEVCVLCEFLSSDPSAIGFLYRNT